MTLLLDANSTNKETCSIIRAAVITKIVIDDEICAVKRTKKMNIFKSAVAPITMNTLKSLDVDDKVQHCLVFKKYNTSPNVASIACASNQISRITKYKAVDVMDHGIPLLSEVA